MLWASLEIDHMRPLVLVTVYRPSQGDHKTCNEMINGAFERANLKDKSDIFMLGDFNMDLSDKTSNKAADLEIYH